MKKLLVVLIVAMSLSLLVVGCAEEEATPTPTGPTPTGPTATGPTPTGPTPTGPTPTGPTPTLAPAADIVDVATADGRFEDLVMAIEAGNVTDTLKGEGPFTVFAPTNDAFAALPPGTLESLLGNATAGNATALQNVLLYHVVPGEFMAADIVTQTSLDTALDLPLTVTVGANETVLINDAQVIEADIMASNGVIHVIDTVLIPPE